MRLRARSGFRARAALVAIALCATDVPPAAPPASVTLPGRRPGMLVPILVGSGGRDGVLVSASGDRRPAWPVVSAWTLWLLTILTLAAVPLLDRLLRQAGRADLVQLTPGTAFPVVAMVSGATVGAVLGSRRPRHPVGWLLLTLALSLTATAAAAQYLTWGLLVRPGALPGARWVALYFSAIGFTAMTSIGLLLLVTPTGSPPSPR